MFFSSDDIGDAEAIIETGLLVSGFYGWFHYGASCRLHDVVEILVRKLSDVSFARQPELDARLV